MFYRTRILLVGLVLTFCLVGDAAAQANGRRGAAKSVVAKTPGAGGAVMTSTTATTANAANPEDAQQLAALSKTGLSALYNLDYEAARKTFREMQRKFPTHPAPVQFLAATLWAEMLNNARRLQASLYGSDTFYEEKEDKPDPKQVAEFRALTRQAETLAKARLKVNPQDTDALYYLGATKGLQAAFAVGIERRFMGALGDGNDAVGRHREVLKIDPNYTDAALTVGVYDYTVASLPLPVKLMANVMGYRGSKKRGLATLEKVAHDGNESRDNAASLLIVLLKREKRYAEALTYARELAVKYPRNYLFRLEAADALVQMAEQARAAKNTAAAQTSEQQAFAEFEALLNDKDARANASRALDLIHFRYGDALFIAGQHERAAQEFLNVTRTPNAEATLVTLAHLKAGQAFDLLNQRDKAVAQYNLVLQRPDVYSSQSDARKGLKEPFKRKG